MPGAFDHNAVGVVGVAAAAAPLTAAFTSSGHRVLAFDPHSSASARPAAAAIEVLSAPDRLVEPHTLIVVSSAALTPARGADVSPVVAAAGAAAGVLRRGQLVVFTGAVSPGTTRNAALPVLAASGLVPGHGFGAAYAALDADQPAVGGIDESATQAARCVLARAGIHAAAVSSLEAAEVCGTVRAARRVVETAFTNELRLACARMGIDAWEVPGACRTGADGQSVCEGVAPLLSWGGRRWNGSFRLLDTAGEVNASIPEYVISKVADALNDAGKAVRGSRVAVLGVADKKDADDPHESPSSELLDHLLKKGAAVSYNDPHIPSLPRRRHWPHPDPMESRELTPEYLAAQDCVLIAADHTAYDYAFIVEHSRLVVDTRNATRAVAAGREKVVRV